MTAFILKSGICMVLLYGLYWLVLRKEKLFVFNRYFLMISVLISLAIPFLTIYIYTDPAGTTNNVLSILNNPVEPNDAGNGNAIPEAESVLSGDPRSALPDQSGGIQISKRGNLNLLPLIYLSGLMLMLIRFVRNMMSVKGMLRKSERIDHHWYRIALLEHHVNPFSFLRTIFLNKKDYLENRISRNVIRHELEHVRQSHSADVIFFEILHIVFWFNPVLFLYKRAASINHEYLADEAVIRRLPDLKEYASDLVNYVSHHIIVPYTSGFSPSRIRLRLLMMKACTTRRGKINHVILTLVMSALLISGLSMKPADQDPKRNAKREIARNSDIVIQEVFFRGNDFKPLEALVVLNGRKLDNRDTITFDPQQIKTIDILEGRKATSKYGRRARSGVVEIGTFESGKRSVADSANFRPIYTINNQIPEETEYIEVSNLYSVSVWTYPNFPNQATKKRWRTIEIMTRDFYKIRGKVVQVNGEPVPGVLVTSTDNPGSAMTGKDGRFLLEDVRDDALAELSADGFEPFYFKVSGVVYTVGLTITLNRKGEADPDESNIAISYIIDDFSGTWRFNKDLSTGSIAPWYEFDYEIFQFDSDSISIHSSGIIDNRKFDRSNRYVFNTVKTEVSENSNRKYIHSCSIGPGGHSFSITNQGKSTIGLDKEMKNVVTYSISGDGNKLTIKMYYFSEPGSTSGKETCTLIYDKI